MNEYEEQVIWDDGWQADLFQRQVSRLMAEGWFVAAIPAAIGGFGVQAAPSVANPDPMLRVIRWVVLCRLSGRSEAPGPPMVESH